MEKVTELAQNMYEDKYLLSSESISDGHLRVAVANLDDPVRATRMHSYLNRHWARGATPVMSNSGTDRGQPISCYKSNTVDSLESIFTGFMEDFILGSGGGGIGRHWDIRSVGEGIKDVGESSGVMPFLKTSDSATNAVSQGALRRASEAAYMNIDNPEIEEFIEIRKPTGGDANRKCMNLHHGVVLTDAFLISAINKQPWDLISPKDGAIIKTVDAYELLQKIIITRMETGEPFVVFYDNVNKQLPKIYTEDMKVKLSNLCTEIFLNTTELKTAVCCLASVNLLRYDEWKDDEFFIEDMMYLLDGVLDQFLAKLEGIPEWQKPFLQKVINFVLEERAVGLGTMGWTSYLHYKGIPFESPMAKGLNIKIFRQIREQADAASIKIAEERGSCELAKRQGILERFSTKMSQAPTSSISILASTPDMVVSPGVDPELTLAYVQKNDTQSITVKNCFFDKLLKEEAIKIGKDGRWVAAQWKSVLAHEGSVQHLEWLDDYRKDVFKTAFEIDQRFIIEQAADRQEFFDQGQSINLFLKHDIHKRDLLGLFLFAWKKGLKSLYYNRSTSAKRASVGSEVKRNVIPEQEVKYEECLSCQ